MITGNAEGVLLWQTGDSPGAKAAFGEAITGSRLTGDNASLAFALSTPGQLRDGPSSSSRLPDDGVKISGRTSYYENHLVESEKVCRPHRGDA